MEKKVLAAEKTVTKPTNVNHRQEITER